MKRKSIISLLCLMMATCFFAGCDMLGLGKEPHVHTFDTEWTHDATSHWYEATCDCEDVEVVKANHVDENNDSLCDVCKYDYDHTHTFQTEDDWTVDCTNHWRAATCGHLVAAQDVEAHADTNGDGKCDTCNYVIEDIHKHVYADGWTTDDEYHWHAAICEHKAEISGKEEHKLNAAGDCLVCGEHLVEVDPTSVEEVLLAAQANDYKISFGDVIATEAVYGGTGAQILENGKTNRVHFALGNGESYIQYISFDKNGNYLGQEEQWFERISEDEVFAAAMLDGEYELSPIAGDAQFLNGYNYIPGSILPSASNDTSTLANLFVGLYKQMKAGERVSAPMEDGVYVAGGNPVEGYDPVSGKYEFAYTYYSVNANTDAVVEGKDEEGNDIVVEVKVNSVELELYNVAVTFSINEDMIIDAADFYVEVYRDYSNIKDGKEVGDPDLSYTYTADKMGNITINDLALKATANPSFYTYTVAQTAGDRSFTTPYPRHALVPTSFEFNYVGAYGEEPVEDSLILEAGEYAKFSIGDVLPKTASTKFMNTDAIEYTFVNKDPNSTAQAWDASETFLNGFWWGYFKLKIHDIGEYTVTLKCGEVTKVFDLSVVAEKPIVLPEDDENTVNVATTDTNCYVDLYSYTAGEADTYTFTLPAGLGMYSKEAYDDYAAPELDVFDPDVDSTVSHNIEVELAAGEKFEFYVGAVTKGAWVIKVTKGIIEEPVLKGSMDDPYELKVGEDVVMEVSEEYVVENYYVYGSLTVEEAGWYAFEGYWGCAGDNECIETSEGVYYYVEENGTILVSKYVDTATSFTVNVAKEDMNVVAAGNGDSEANAIAITGEGSYGITLDYSVSADGAYVNFSVAEAGYYTFSFSNYNNTATYDGVVYSSNGDNGDLTLYAEVGTTYSIVLDNMDYDADWNIVEASGSFFLNVSKLVSLTVGENTVVGSGEANEIVVLSVETSGWYVVSIEELGMGSIYLYGDISIDGYSAWSTSVYSTTVELEAGKVYTTSVNYPSDEMTWKPLTGSWKITVEEGEEPVVEEITLALGDNQIEAKNVVYAYTATEAGTLNLAAGGAAMGMVSISYTVNGGESTVLELSTNVDLTLAAGDKVVITVEAEGYSTLTASWTAASGSGEGEETEPDGSESNPYVITEETSMVLSVAFGSSIYVKVSAGLTVTLDSVAHFENASGDNLGTSVTATEETVYLVCADSMAGGMCQLTATVGGSSEEPVEPEFPALKIGSTPVEQKSATYQHIATEDGTLTLKAGAALMGSATFSYSINGGEAVSFAPQASVEIVLSKGDKVLVTVNAENDYSSITANWTAKSDGTESKPYVVESLPADLTVEANANDMIWYTFTVETAGTFTATFDSTDTWFRVVNAEGTVLISGYQKDVYTGSLSAGTYTMGIANWTTASTLNVNVKVTVATATGSVVSYVGASASGRAMKVTIDKEAGTLSVIRATLSGNNLEVSQGATEYTGTYSFDGTTVTATISGCTITWAADGSPESIVWGSGTYTNFVVQA